jgi:hypothetical protein
MGGFYLPNQLLVTLRHGIVRNALAAPIHAIEADTMTTMTVQDYAPLIATGSHKRYLDIKNIHTLRVISGSQPAANTKKYHRFRYIPKRFI